MDGTVDEYRPAAELATKLAETLKLFDLSPSKFPFDDRRVKKILERRKQLQGELFFDYLLQQAGISKPTRIFPPLNLKQFEVLIREILSSDWGITEIGGLSQEVNEFSQETAATRNAHKNLQSGIKRACLIYYLLAWWDDEPHLKYSEEMRLASHFTELTHAHFLFDIGVTANAASLLCTPLIVPEPSLVRKVFHALSISTDADPSVLILRYARMAKPDLSSEEVLFRYVDALAKVNFTEAWSYQRTLEGKRQDILGVIYQAILCPRPLRAALQLLSVLPLQSFEQQFLHHYALSPPPEIPETSVAALHSLIILRLTVEGNYSRAVQLNREFSQYAEKLLNSSSFEDSRSFGLDARSRPGILIAQRAEESREMLRESVSLLPLEHRRQLESQLSDGGLSATASFGNPNAMVNNAMEMSWEAITAPTGAPMHSTPPRASSAGPITSPSNPGGANARSPIAIPSSPSKGPSSPQKKSPLVSKFQPPMAPIDTQTLGRVFVNKPPTPKRAGLLAYMTPLRTPMLAAKTGGTMNGSAGGVDPDRSGAPPPTTGRAGSKNAFFDPDVRAVKGLILPSTSSPLAAIDRSKAKVPRFDDDDVEMREVDPGADTESEEEVQEEVEGQSDESFVYAPPASSHLKSNISGGLLSASSIVQMKKTQERGRDRMEKEREAKERERERLAAREREIAAKRAKLEQQRRNLEGNDSSFTSTGSGGAGKRKRDGDDQMTRTDDEMEDADMSSGIGGKAKRKSDGGAVQVVRKLASTSTASANPAAPFPTTSTLRRIQVPAPAQSVVSSRSGALVPPTTMAPSVTSAGGKEDHVEPRRRSSRISATSGSAPGSVAGGSQAGGSAKAPSPTPERSEPVDSDEDDEPTSPQMPGAYILDEGDNMMDDNTSVRKTRGAKPRSVAKPPSKSKATKPASKKATASTSTATGTQPARQRRSGRHQISVPMPIAEDSVLEVVGEDDAMRQSPSKGKARGKRVGSTAPASTNRRDLKAVVEDTTEPEMEDHMDGVKAGTTGRRSSRRLTALTTGETDVTTSASSATGGRKSGRRA